MNILIIGTTDNMGGASRVSWDIAKEAEKRGHKVHFLVGRKKTNSPNVQQIKINNTSDFIKKYTRKDVDLYLKQLRDYLLSNDIEYGESESILNHPWYKEADIVHLHNLHGNYFKLKTIERISKEKKVIWTLHDMWSFTGHCAHSFDCERYVEGCGQCPYLKTYFPYLLDRTSSILLEKAKIYNNSNLRLVVPSNWIMAKVKNSILNDKESSLVYNGIDTKIFKKYDKQQSRKELKLPINKKIILTVSQGGSKNIYKGSEYIKSLSEKIKDKNIIILSIGGMSGNIGNVKGVGYISEPKILAKYYSSADVFVFPSLAENCPLVVLESMSCGLPVVAFNIGGISELIEHKNYGYLSKYKDGDDLLNGVNYILNKQKDEYSLISKQCMDTVGEKFSVSKMADEYEKIYTDI